MSAQLMAGGASIHRAVPPRYSSQSIAARRRRILEQTKLLIAESGIAGFTLRELGLRAGVSVTTIYNIFGDKEGVIAHALREFHLGIRLDLPDSSTRLDTYLQAIAHTTRVVIENRAYALALADLYFSSSLVPAIFDVIRSMPLQVFNHFYELAQREGRLLEGIEQRFVETSFANLEWACVKDWGAGRIADADLAAARQRAFVMTVLGICADATCRTVALALQRVCRPPSLTVALRHPGSPDVIQR